MEWSRRNSGAQRTQAWRKTWVQDPTSDPRKCRDDCSNIVIFQKFSNISLLWPKLKAKVTLETNVPTTNDTKVRLSRCAAGKKVKH